MDPIETTLREDFLLEIFDGEYFDVSLHYLLGHSPKTSGLGITKPTMLAVRHPRASKKICEDIISSLL